jgi:hypothetical protein
MNTREFALVGQVDDGRTGRWRVRAGYDPAA